MPAGTDKNLRKMTVSTSTGKDHRDTMVTSGEAKKTAAERETNETTQYTTGKMSAGSLGGKNTNS
jgi:hypothetical protein